MPKIIDTEERKNIILEAGLKALNNGEFKMGRVADMCGISRTVIYCYYSSKEELASEVMRNFGKLSTAEKCKYLLKNAVIPSEVYEKIWDLINEKTPQTSQTNKGELRCVR